MSRSLARRAARVVAHRTGTSALPPVIARARAAASAAVVVSERPFWTVRPAAKAADADELWIYDEIGFSWFDEGITAASFAKDLSALKASRLTLRINSPGGDVFDGLAIKNLIADHPAHVTAKVDGLSASIASVIMQAADEIEVEPHAQIMIHDASGYGYGNAADLRETADLLDMISNNIAQVYADAAGGTQSDWRKVMKGEKWYTAEEAVKAGLADRVGTPEGGRKTTQCPDCGGDGGDCETCGGTGRVAATEPDPDEAKAAKARAERLRVAARWCRDQFPGHEQAFENALAELPEAATGDAEDDEDADDEDDEGEQDDAPKAPALPAPAAREDGPVPPTTGTGASQDGGEVVTEPEQFAFEWDASALTGAVRAATSPPSIELTDWRSWFADAPAASLPDRSGPVNLGPAPARPAPAPETPRNPLAELIGAAVDMAANDQPARPVDDKNTPVDLGPAPERRPAAPPAVPRNPLAEQIGAAVDLAAKDQPAADLEPESGPELPPLPPIRIDVADMRRAVREARF